jgi:HAD superfamily hydrolase (TIGR01490 family)
VKTAAFFDVDGTLLRGFIIHSFPRYLGERGIVDPVFSRRIDLLIDAYRRGNATYRAMAEQVPRIYADAITGVEVNRVREAAQGFTDTHLSHSIYQYTRALVDLARRHFEVVIALSGSPEEPVQKLHSLGFNSEHGSVFESRDGVYTGKILSNLILGEEKAAKMRQVAGQLDVDLKRSAAFGDTGEDVPMLESVGLPIVINPTEGMKQICQERGWRSFTPEDLPRGIERLLVQTKM